MRVCSLTHSRAAESHSLLVNQRKRLESSRSKVLSVFTRLPMVNELMRKIGDKKTRDNLIVAVVMACCIFFCIWYILHSLLFYTNTRQIAYYTSQEQINDVAFHRLDQLPDSLRNHFVRLVHFGPIVDQTGQMDLHSPQSLKVLSSHRDQRGNLHNSRLALDQSLVVLEICQMSRFHASHRCLGTRNMAS